VLAAHLRVVVSWCRLACCLLLPPLVIPSPPSHTIRRPSRPNLRHKVLPTAPTATTTKLQTRHVLVHQPGGVRHSNQHETNSNSNTATSSRVVVSWCRLACSFLLPPPVVPSPPSHAKRRPSRPHLCHIVLPWPWQQPLLLLLNTMPRSDRVGRA
jgi:hypothetical protein